MDDWRLEGRKLLLQELSPIGVLISAEVAEDVEILETLELAFKPIPVLLVGNSLARSLIGDLSKRRTVASFTSCGGANVRM